MLTLLGVGLLAVGAAAGPPEGPPANRPGSRAPAGPVLGVAINAHHIGDLSLYLDGVDAIAELGANALLLVSPGFQERVDSTQIRFDPGKCPTDAQLIAILRRARSRGLHTTLLPIVLIEQPGEKDWRGVIRPRDRDAWWRSYQRFSDRFLDIAAAADVDALSVGSELNSMEGDLDRWRHVIDRARERFSGRVTYTANWDRYQTVRFWEWVDFISVSAYFELARDDPKASLPRLASAWRVEREKLLRFARGKDRSLLLMELGYPSLPWAAAHPWNYVAGAQVTADHDAQARCYAAFFKVWSETISSPGSGALGFHCYAWDPYHHGGQTDTGYGIRGKPALRVIKQGLREIRRSAENPR
jgi:hypothetical protein